MWLWGFQMEGDGFQPLRVLQCGALQFLLGWKHTMHEIGGIHHGWNWIALDGSLPLPWVSSLSLSEFLIGDFCNGISGDCLYGLEWMRVDSKRGCGNLYPPGAANFDQPMVSMWMFRILVLYNNLVVLLLPNSLVCFYMT